MRQQAKPFTVEIKKSRKSSSESKPLFGGLLEEAVAAEASAASAEADRVFGRSTPRPDDTPDIAAVFGARPVERPATRVLPDLTVRAPEPEPEEPQRTRRPRIAKTKGPKIPAPKPLPVKLVAPQPKKPEPPPAEPTAPVRVRRRAKDESGLARSERWKRRLPQFAR
jgi:hypothetical protein